MKTMQQPDKEEKQETLTADELQVTEQNEQIVSTS